VSKARVVRQGPRGVIHLTLGTLRVASGKSVTQIASAMKATIETVYSIESLTSDQIDKCSIAWVRAYVEAVGDKLELVAVSPYGHCIAIVGVEPYTKAKRRQKA
jgi:hypothetical protein